MVICVVRLQSRGTRRESGIMVKLLANLVGIAGACLYVGYFTYSVAETPLTVIVVISLLLMIYAFIDDMRVDRAVAEANRESGRS